MHDTETLEICFRVPRANIFSIVVSVAASVVSISFVNNWCVFTVETHGQKYNMEVLPKRATKMLFTC